MFYLGAFLLLGLIFRRLIKGSLGPSVAKWSDDTLKSWRTLLIFIFLGGMIFGWDWHFIIPATILAALSWVGVLALSATAKRGRDKAQRIDHEVIRRTETRSAQRRPDHSQSASQLRRVQKAAPLPQIPSQGEYARKFERAEKVDSVAAVVEKPGPESTAARVRFRGSDGSIDLTELIAAASDASSQGGTTVEAKATEAVNSARESAKAFMQAAQGADADAAGVEPAPRHDERHSPWEISAANADAQRRGEEAGERAVARAEKRERELKPAVIAGHTSGPVTLTSGVASMFDGSHETPLSRAKSGPIKSLAAKIPHYQLDLRSSKEKEAQAKQGQAAEATAGN